MAAGQRHDQVRGLADRGELAQLAADRLDLRRPVQARHSAQRRQAGPGWRPRPAASRSAPGTWQRVPNEALIWDFVLARLAGLEPATHCLEGSCSLQLSYRRSQSIVPEPGPSLDSLRRIGADLPIVVFHDMARVSGRLVMHLVTMSVLIGRGRGW